VEGFGSGSKPKLWSVIQGSAAAFCGADRDLIISSRKL
jgi:hypothetical protein